MRYSMRRVPFAALFAVAALTEASRAASIYSVTNLGDLPGGLNESRAWGINESGQVVGESHTSTGPFSTGLRAFLWTPSTPNGTTGLMSSLGALIPVGYPGPTSSAAFGINDSGQVIGTGSISGGTNPHAFLWKPTTPNGTAGSVVDLGDLPGGSDVSFGDSINSNGQVVGESDTSTVSAGTLEVGRRAFLWTPGTPNGTTGTMVSLGTLPGASSSGALGVNTSGQVAGYTYSGINRAFLWTPTTPNGTTGSMVNLGTLPGGTDASRATDINESGQVVGLTGTSNNPTSGHAFLWTPTTPNGSSGSMVDLGDLPGGLDYSWASAINNIGQVTGTSSHIAFLWTAEDGILDLNTLLDASGAGWHLQSANDINDAGQIVGYGLYDLDGAGGAAAVTRGFLLTPIPEPGGIVVMGCIGAMLLPRRCARACSFETT